MKLITSSEWGSCLVIGGQCDLFSWPPSKPDGALMSIPFYKYYSIYLIITSIIIVDTGQKNWPSIGN